MTDKMVNGILFIIAGLGSIAVYIGLGDTGLLDKGHTEKIAAYALVTIPIAFMMTRNIVINTFIDAGFTNNSCWFEYGTCFRCYNMKKYMLIVYRIF